MTSGLTMNHKIGDILLTTGIHKFAVIVDYDPDGFGRVWSKFCYKVRHLEDEASFFYTTEMVTECKKILETFYEREASNR